MTDSPESPELRCFRDLVRTVELAEVRLVDLETSVRDIGPPRTTEGLDLAVAAPEFRFRVPAPDQLLYCGVHYSVTCRLTADSSASDERKPAFQLSATYAVFYEVPDNVMPLVEEGVAIFAGKNAVFNSWPYLRELVQSVSAKMAMPSVVLPLLRLPPEAQEVSPGASPSLPQPANRSAPG